LYIRGSIAGREGKSRSVFSLGAIAETSQQLRIDVSPADDGDVHLAIADVDYSKVSIVIDMHLAHVGDALNFLVVCDERDTPRPRAGAAA